MRVLQMIDSLKWGGAQKMQIFLAESVRPLGIELSVVSLKSGTNSTVPDELRRWGADVRTFDFPRLFSPVSFLRLVGYIQKSRFDLIHTHLSNANIIGTLAGRLVGIPVIPSLRSSGLDQRYQRPARVFLENLVVSRGASRVMANGWAVGDTARKRFAPREIDILPNAIDLIPSLPVEERRTLRTQLVGDPDRVLILSVGRLTDLKGFPDLLTAFAQVHQAHPEAALVIAGDGSDRARLQAQISASNLTGHAFLLGVRNDVNRLMAAADVYAMASHIEGLPVTILEAMAAGLPVVATSVGDTPYVVAPGMGIVVEPYHPEQIAQAVLSLLDNPEQRRAFGEAAQDHIGCDFNRQCWVLQLLRLYAHVSTKAQPILDSVEAC